MRFIDLFAGLGGFHLALHELGHECVFASEINGELREVYEQNFHLKPQGDISLIQAESIPQHDILCAGFPCQPFSKAGDQKGFTCPKRGNLFFDIVRILNHHHPTYIILENVANLENHDGGNTLTTIKRELEKLDYHVQYKVLSPHHYGVPQIRPRIFIIGSKKSLAKFTWPEKHINQTSINDILDKNPADAIELPERIQHYLRIWQIFLDKLGNDILPLPIWSMEFGATYPYEHTTPFKKGLQQLQEYKGIFGRSLENKSDEEIENNLPSYAYSHPKSKVEKFPKWKIKYIRQNREFYEKHKSWLDDWIQEVISFQSSFQKFEWNCGNETRNISNLVVQLRSSGIRVKRRNTISSLVGITTQIPIITWENRYITLRERARLQSMDALEYLPDHSQSLATLALGNAVNVNLVKLIASELLKEDVCNE